MKANKIKAILLPEKGHPLVHLDFALRSGSLCDPEGRDGAASISMSMLLRGTKRHDAKSFHETLDQLGGDIQMGRYKESMRIYGTILAEKLGAFLDLIEEMLVEPKFDEREFEKVKKIFKSSLLDELGSDDEISDRRFQEYCLWGNPYGKLTSGSLESIDSISIEDVKRFHRENFFSKNFIVGATGGFDRKWLNSRLEKIFQKLPALGESPQEVKKPSLLKKKNLLVLDKPGATQCHVMIGSEGLSFKDKDYLSMQLANHVFGGGSFSARLMREVREKRGWSYGAYSWFKSGKHPLYFVMQAVPSNKDAIPALQLMLKLYRQYAQKGITKEEFQFAKKSMLNQSAFLQDTLRKRLDNRVTESLLDLPQGYYDNYRKKLQRISYANVQSAIRRKANTKTIFAMILGDSSSLKADLASVKGFAIAKRKFDEAPSQFSAT